MIKKLRNIFSFAHLFLLLTFLSFLLPSKYKAEMQEGLKSPLVFIIVLLIIEFLFLIKLFGKKDIQSSKDILAFVFGFIFLWELLVSRFNIFPYVFVPAPENVFYIFISDTKKILLGFLSSMFLLITGLFSAISSAVILGTFVGWNQRLTKAIYPIVKAISTVPPLIYTPYVVLIMPTYTIASFTVIFLSIFWGVFMSSINNTAFVEKKIINSARVLNLPTATILFKVIIPFNFPRIFNGLPINIATAIMTLTAAEMLGADNGMGYYVRYSLSFANYTKAIAGIIFIALVVTLINNGISAAKKYLIKWNY